MMVLDSLKSLGYDVEIKENNIRLSYKGEGRPDKNRVLPLLEELKANKDRAIKELQKGGGLKPAPEEILDDLYMQTMHKINDQYLKGTIRFIEKNYPYLDRQIDKVDKQINEIWKSCLQGETGLNDFEEALNTYQNLYLEGIDIYTKVRLKMSRRRFSWNGK